MAKSLSFKSGLSSTLFWSIIAAAFIGPGTITTAAKSGTDYETALIWALVFSIFATIILQEAAARITIASGKSLGEILDHRFGSKTIRFWKYVLFFMVAFGCAAYQAGNILGGVAGALLIFPIDEIFATVLIAIVALLFLLSGDHRTIAKLLGGVVALMGIAFVVVAMRSGVSAKEILISGMTPSLPPGSLLLAVGLVGTTVVPYNLFLASGIARGQNINQMRTGIVAAVLIGGIISIAILLTGTLFSGAFSFQGLAAILSENLGNWSGGLFAFGLFAAGLTSAITAPFAAAITGRALFGQSEDRWSGTGKYFRITWGVILLTGLVFGLSGIKPVPAIIAAQAINGILLPGIAIFLLIAVNDRKILGSYTNSSWLNVATGLVVLVTLILGGKSLWLVFNSIF